MKEFLIAWKDAAPAAGAMIATVSVVVAFFVFIYTRRANRRRATLDMVMKTLMDADVQAKYRKFRDLIRKNEDAGDAFKISSLAEDAAVGTDDRNVVTHQLNIYELMALGIRRKLFDEAFYKRWYHNQFMMDYEGAADFVKAMQAKKASIYCEQSSLYAKWLKDGHPVSSPNRFKMAVWAFRKQHTNDRAGIALMGDDERKRAALALTHNDKALLYLTYPRFPVGFVPTENDNGKRTFSPALSQ